MSGRTDIVLFSGGRSSAAMLLELIRRKAAIDLVLFQNTGMENEETLNFVDWVGRQIPMPIIWLEYRWDEEPPKRFKVVDFESAARKGEPFREMVEETGEIPNRVMRSCTRELKIYVVRRFLRSRKIDLRKMWENVGLRADEQQRVANMRNRNAIRKDDGGEIAPLADWNWTKSRVMQFWLQQADQIRSDLGIDIMDNRTHLSNCIGCFNSREKEQIGTVLNHPEMARRWADMEDAGTQTKLRRKSKIHAVNKHRRAWCLKHLGADYAPPDGSTFHKTNSWREMILRVERSEQHTQADLTTDDDEEWIGGCMDGYCGMD